MRLVITGPNGISSQIVLDEKALTLGRAADNDLSYPEDPALSRRHLQIKPANGGWSIEDCNSRNGTIVNNRLLEGSRVLAHGDRIQVGQLSIEVERTTLDTGAPQGRGSTISTTLEEVLGHHGIQPAATQLGSLGPNRIVSALIRAGQELAGHRPLNELFDLILDLALSAVEAQRGVMLTIEDGELSVKASRGDGFSLSRSVRTEVLTKKASLMISDAQFDAAFREQKSIVTQKVRSMMAAPLQTQERVIGLIYVDNGAILRPFSREDLDLLTVMANVAAIRIEHARLAIVEQQERLTQVELDQACEIQRGLLPEAPPEIEGYEIAGFNIACRAVGGDYYDYFRYRDGRLGLLVADVCGKGMPAALMMSGLQARAQLLADSDPSPSAATTTLNRNLDGKLPMGRFITAFYGALDPKTGILQYANAGHNYPLLVQANGEVKQLRGGSVPLGLFPEAKYADFEVTLGPGEMLVLYSDGVTEASRPKGTGDIEQFGESRLAEFLHTHVSERSADILPELAAYVRSWTGSPAFDDDFTAVIVKRHSSH